MRNLSGTLTLGVALLLGSGSALADERAALVEAFSKAMAKGSYSMEIQSQDKGRAQSIQMKVIFPDRYHMRTPDTEIIILPQGTWMSAGGQWMKAPMNMSQMIAGYSREAMEKGLEGIGTVERIGTEQVGGCSADLYRYRASGEFMGVRDASTQTVAVCRDSGLPRRMVSEGKDAVTIHYDFESPVSIAPPN